MKINSLYQIFENLIFEYSENQVSKNQKFSKRDYQSSIALAIETILYTVFEIRKIKNFSEPPLKLSEKHIQIIQKEYENDQIKLCEDISSLLEEFRGKIFSLNYQRENLQLASSHTRREKGVFYTPPNLADQMVSNAIDLIANRIKSFDDIKNTSILDPAVGCGVFLLSSLRLLTERLSAKIEFKTSSYQQILCFIAENCLYGVDIDPISIAITRALIVAEVGSNDFNQDALFNNLRLGDSIASQMSDWACWFPGTAEKGFDLIATNPPWSKLRPLKREFFEHLDKNVKLFQGRALSDYLELNIQSSDVHSWQSYVNRSLSLSFQLKSSPEYSLNSSS